MSRRRWATSDSAFNYSRSSKCWKAEMQLQWTSGGQQLECWGCCILKMYEKLLIKQKPIYKSGHKRREIVQKHGNKQLTRGCRRKLAGWVLSLYLLRCLWPNGIQSNTMFLISAKFCFTLFSIKFSIFLILHNFSFSICLRLPDAECPSSTRKIQRLNKFSVFFLNKNM